MSPDSPAGRGAERLADDSADRTQKTRVRWPSIACGLIVVLGFLAASAPVTTNDLFWHVETGRHLWSVGGFPGRDVFSYTANDLPWFLHEWLTQVLFFGIHELGGLLALRVFTGLAAAGILFLFWRLATRHLPHPVAALAVLLAFAILGTCRFQTRPTLFSMAFFIGLLTWLSGHRGAWRVRDAAILVAATLVWVNLHSVGLLALFLFGAFAAGRLGGHWLAREPSAGDLLRFSLTGAVLAAATCTTPSGFHIYGFAFQDKGEVMDFIVDEWGPFRLDFSGNPMLTPEAYGVVLAVLATVVAVYVLTGVALNSEANRRASPAMPEPVQLAVLSMCLAGGLAARRFHWMLAVSLLFALSHGARLIRYGYLLAVLRPRVLAAAGTVIAVVLAALHYHRDLCYEERPLHRSLASSDYYTRGIAPSLDLPAVQFAREAGLEGNAYCHYGSGGMLTYFLYPKVRVFIDSRADLYRREVLLDFLAIRDGHPDQQRLLDAYGTDIYFRHWEIAPLNEPSRWAKVYAAPDGEVWLRKHPRNLDNVQRCRTYYRRHPGATPPR